MKGLSLTKVKAETNLESEDRKMYICEGCGKIMARPSSWIEPHGEMLSGCSRCGGGVEEAIECEMCGEYHLEEDLTNGVCEECLKDCIDFEIAFKYLTETKRLREFFIVWSWGLAEKVDEDKKSDEVDQTLIAIFKSRQEKDSKKFIEELEEYILDDIYDWSEFLAKEVNK